MNSELELYSVENGLSKRKLGQDTPPPTEMGILAGEAAGARAPESFVSRGISAQTQTTMSCPLPPEILDLIVDHLHDEQTTLQACCLVSKSWIPRTRKHLFAHIRFHPTDRPIQSWKQMFPDPSNSPAHHASSLFLQVTRPGGLADPGVVPWIRSFNRVETLHAGLKISALDQVSLVQLHGFSPTLKSLHLGQCNIPLPGVFRLVCSFPLLEDLELFAFGFVNDIDNWDPPSTSPKLTGSLKIDGGFRSVARGLCDLPGGLRFSKIMLRCEEEDVIPMMDLVSSCSDTLESLSIRCDCTFNLASVIGQHLTTGC